MSKHGNWKRNWNAIGIWHLDGIWTAFGIWKRNWNAIGIWHLEFGIWQLEFGIWNLAFGIWGKKNNKKVSRISFIKHSLRGSK
jgi:hypothetical protein